MKAESFFDYDKYMPHGMCYLWQPDILWTSVISDVITALAYFSITAAVVWFVKNRKDLPYPSFFILAGSVIFLACGTSHLISAIVIWEPIYGISAISKAITATTSLATGIIIWFVLPFFLSLPSPAMLERKNQALQDSLNKLNIAQKSVVESQRLASLGSLVAGMAHELNTPIGICITATSFIEDELKASQSGSKGNSERVMRNIQSGLDLILSNLERTKNLVSMFKEVAVEKPPERESRLFLKEFITDLVRILIQKFEMNEHQVTVHCSSTLEVECNPNSLIHIVTNLFTNSVVHGFKNRAEGQISVHISVNEKKVIRLIYRDNGVGLNKDQIDKIFDPFYTTKRGRGGPGLGMTIAYNTISSLDGTIVCESVQGSNTTFTIDLPLVIYDVENAVTKNQGAKTFATNS
ncbi:MAG: HAMP domain-containing histidine kinase [Colwellia sp.]|nr:HAMP domain-containing histidine kinase [Colwellia sp.]